MFDMQVITSPKVVDCGPTCLKMLLNYYNIESSLDALIKSCNLNIVGCTAKDIMNAAKIYDVELKAYKMSTEELMEQDRPAIIWWKHNHFCMFCGVNDKEQIVIINPDRGRYAIPKNTFKIFYSGVALFNGQPIALKKQLTLEEKFNALIKHMGLQGRVEGNTFIIEEQNLNATDFIE